MLYVLLNITDDVAIALLDLRMSPCGLQLSLGLPGRLYYVAILILMRDWLWLRAAHKH